MEHQKLWIRWRRINMLEARFVNLKPFMQQMFLKLHDIEDFEKKDFILETLHREFRDVAIEARKVFERFNMLGSPVNVVGTTKEDFKLPIPCKLVGLLPKRDHKGSSKTHLDIIQFIVENNSAIDLNASFDIT
jgi:hypothetical protein